jgi:hypothetical protein
MPFGAQLPDALAPDESHRWESRGLGWIILDRRRSGICFEQMSADKLLLGKEP